MPNRIQPKQVFQEDTLCVTEIYWCDDGFDGDTENFIKNAADRGIKVYWLSGKYEWLRDDKPLYRLIEKYNDFQNSAVYRYAGIHLDIEPSSLYVSTHSNSTLPTDKA